MPLMNTNAIFLSPMLIVVLFLVVKNAERTYGRADKLICRGGYMPISHRILCMFGIIYLWITYVKV